MSSTFECNICHHSFASRSDNGDIVCPSCGSHDILLKSPDYLISTALLKKLIIAELVLIAFALAVVLLRYNDGPRISKVEVDKSNHTITIIVKASALKKSIDYSIDYGKTYQNSKTFQIKDPGNYIIVIRDEKNRKAVWDDPIVFLESDFNSTEEKASVLLPHITGIEPFGETEPGKNDGRIMIHIKGGKKPVKYSINGGKSLSNDSIFSSLTPAKYNIFIIDDESHIDTYFEPVTIEKGIVSQPVHILSQPPSRSLIESKLNRLFADPENKGLVDSIQGYFISQTMKVDCDLAGITTNTPYQLYQFLQRRYDGEPGTKRIQVIEIGYDNQRKINKLKVKEAIISNN